MSEKATILFLDLVLFERVLRQGYQEQENELNFSKSFFIL